MTNLEIDFRLMDTSPKVYNVSYLQPTLNQAGTIPVEAESRREATEIIIGRLGPNTVAMVTGSRGS